MATRYVTVIVTTSVTLTFHLSYQIARLQQQYNALSTAQANDAARRTREIAEVEGRMDAINKFHQSELASNALISTIVESAFQQGLASTRETLETTSIRLQEGNARSSRLSQSNLELEEHVANLQRLTERRVEVPITAVIPQPLLIPSIAPAQQNGDSQAPLRSTSRRPPNSGRNLFAALSGAGIQIRGASERNAREKPTSSRNWKEARSLLYYIFTLCLLVSSGQYDANVEPPTRRSKFGFPNY